MEGIVKSLVHYAGTLVLCCANPAICALASPPFGKTTATRPAALPTHLDLRPPAAREFAVSALGRSTTETSSVVVKPAKHFSLGTTAGQGRDRNGAEAFARRFHREGLPVARLWENHSAFLGLGLNQKGKPGLWLVQKTH
ncbi:MAG TPA: hypothetical protein VNR70_12105 [Steroidobacteraceae bacterium]|nr:hypothetical protein [Steroidobacteraceae bacterium]